MDSRPVFRHGGVQWELSNPGQRDQGLLAWTDQQAVQVQVQVLVLVLVLVLDSIRLT